MECIGVFLAAFLGTATALLGAAAAFLGAAASSRITRNRSKKKPKWQMGVTKSAWER